MNRWVWRRDEVEIEGRTKEARLREFNPNHEPAGSLKGGQFAKSRGAKGGSPVGVISSYSARRGGLPPRNDWEKESLWFDFPQGGDGYTAKPLKTIPLDALDDSFAGRSWVEQEQRFKALLPTAPKGMELVLRIGSKQETGGLAGKNAANVKGLIDFIDLETEGGDHTMTHAFGVGKQITVFAVSIAKRGGPETYVARGFKKKLPLR